MNTRSPTLIWSLRLAWLAATAAAIAMVGNCAAPGRGPSSLGRFPQSSISRAWPAPPDPARIRWVGQITNAADLGIRAEGALLRAVTGAAGPALRFAAPAAVAAAGSRVVVADPQHPDGPMVHVIDRDAGRWTRMTTAAGKPLEWPMDVALVDGRIAIADAKRKAVLLVGEDGTGTTIGGAALQRPAGVAYDAARRELWVVDTGGHDIAVFDAGGTLKRRVGGRGAGAGQFNFPTAAAFLATTDPGAVLVADSMNFRVQLLSDAGSAQKSWGKKGDAAGDFSLPRDCAVDSDGNLYVLDSQFENVQIFDRSGRLLLAFAAGGAGPGELNVPGGIWIDDNDWIWIADTRNRRIQVFEYLKAAPSQEASS